MPVSLSVKGDLSSTLRKSVYTKCPLDHAMFIGETGMLKVRTTKKKNMKVDDVPCLSPNSSRTVG